MSKSYIDLHMHSLYSDDGEFTPTQLVEMCHEAGVKIMAIADHNWVKAIEEAKKKAEELKMEYIPAIEIDCIYKGINLHVLGYGIDYKKMNELVKEVYIPAQERNKIEVKRLYDKCCENNIVLDNNCLENYNPDMFASEFFHKEITKHAENRDIITSEAWNSSKHFYRQYMSDPKNKLYVKMDDLVPDFETASKLVRDAGGLVFIPHIFEYKKNSEMILEFILKNYKIDGIECYYTTFTHEQHERLIKLCKEKNIFISGGCDFHGKNKPDVDIGIGYGNLSIPEEILTNWIGLVRKF